MDSATGRLFNQVNAQLPAILQQLAREGFDPLRDSLQLECSVRVGPSKSRPNGVVDHGQVVDGNEPQSRYNQVSIASVDIAEIMTSLAMKSLQRIGSAPAILDEFAQAFAPNNEWQSPLYPQSQAMWSSQIPQHVHAHSFDQLRGLKQMSYRLATQSTQPSSISMPASPTHGPHDSVRTIDDFPKDRIRD